jgi:hypothetical protein
MGSRVSSLRNSEKLEDFLTVHAGGVCEQSAGQLEARGLQAQAAIVFPVDFQFNLQYYSIVDIQEGFSLLMKIRTPTRGWPLPAERNA